MNMSEREEQLIGQYAESGSFYASTGRVGQTTVTGNRVRTVVAPKQKKEADEPKPVTPSKPVVTKRKETKEGKIDVPIVGRRVVKTNTGASSPGIGGTTANAVTKPPETVEISVPKQAVVTIDNGAAKPEAGQPVTTLPATAIVGKNDITGMLKQYWYIAVIVFLLLRK